MQKIIPHLWYDKEAKEAAEFYVSVFGNSKVLSHRVLRGTPSGDCDLLSFELWGYKFMSISAGPYFKFNPAISISVQCHDEAEINRIHAALTAGGSELMPLAVYPWSKKYAWVADRYGLTWQLNLPFDDHDYKDRISPSLMFTQGMAGKAEEAMKHYASIFPNSKISFVARYAKDEGDTEGFIKHALFELLGQNFIALDSSADHKFVFNEAVSLLVNCDTQEEIDEYWQKLSAVPAAEQCGWLADKYGVSWQISPSAMHEMMEKGTPEQVDRLTKAFLAMKKFDLAKLEAAFEGK